MWRDVAWVPMVTTGPGKIMILPFTNADTYDLMLNYGALLGLSMTENMVPRSPGYLSVGSKRYNELETVAYEAIVERETEDIELYSGPIVDHPKYAMPLQILSRSVMGHPVT